MGRVLIEAGYFEQAEGHLLAANREKPHPPALWALGQLYEKADRLDDAATAYSALVKLRGPQAEEARARLEVVNAKRRERGR
jgi:Flp pilus assembly protein TadD